MKNILFLISLFLFSSCSEKNEVVIIPESILQKDNMVQVMTDLQLLEASLSLNLLEGGQGSDKNPGRYAEVFKKHKTNGKQYYESFKFYTQHPALLSEIYDEVLKELNKQLAESSK